MTPPGRRAFVQLCIWIAVRAGSSRLRKQYLQRFSDLWVQPATSDRYWGISLSPSNVRWPILRGRRRRSSGTSMREEGGLVVRVSLHFE